MKRLYKTDENKILCGVCAGMAEYFNIDPSLIRLGTVLFCCIGAGIIFYIAAAFILPRKRDLGL